MHVLSQPLYIETGVSKIKVAPIKTYRNLYKSSFFPRDNATAKIQVKDLQKDTEETPKRRCHDTPRKEEAAAAKLRCMQERAQGDAEGI
jgi:hypothetical protein